MRWSLILAGLLLVLTGCVDSSAVDRPPSAKLDITVEATASSPVASSEPTTALPPSVAVFLGDSYTSGWDGVGIGEDSWASIVTNTLGARSVNLAVAGTGFVRGGIHGGTEGSRIGTQIPAAIAAQPTIVFLAAGLNDTPYPRSRVLAAAHDSVVRLRAGLPTARIIMIGPWWPGPGVTPPATLVALRDQLRVDAARIGALFIDPYGEGWFSGQNLKFIGADGLHPTSAGYEFIAQRVLRAIDR